jgi:hypothetical protein
MPENFENKKEQPLTEIDTVIPEEMADRVEHQEKPEEKDLTWSDLEYISNNNLGLRHVSSQKIMEKNFSEGFYGDSLAISNIKNTIHEGLIPESLLELVSRFDIKPDLDLLTDVLDDDKKAEIVQNFSNAVAMFIEDSMNFDERLERGITKEGYVESLRGRHSFLLVKNDAQRGYDNQKYYKFGKSGKKQYEPSDILATLSAIEIVEALKASRYKPGDTADNDFDKEVSEIVYRLIVTKIKSVKKNSKIQ